MAKQPKNELVVVGFNYSSLDTKTAEKAHSAADRIKTWMGKTRDDLIEVGKALQEIKDAMPHGQFGAWLHAEFGWSVRKAQGLMSVAESFKCANFAHLTFQPSALYLLAAPAVPDKARQVAIEKAEAGEEITYSTAKEIVADAKRKGKKKAKPVPADKLAERLARSLEKYRARWNQKELGEFARQLREFADELDAGQKGGKKKARG